MNQQLFTFSAHDEAIKEPLVVTSRPAHDFQAGFRWPAEMADSYAGKGGDGRILAERRGWNARALEIARDADGAITIRAFDGAKKEVIFDKVPATKPGSGTIGFRTQYQQLSVTELRVTTP